MMRTCVHNHYIFIDIDIDLCVYLVLFLLSSCFILICLLFNSLMLYIYIYIIVYFQYVLNMYDLCIFMFTHQKPSKSRGPSLCDFCHQPLGHRYSLVSSDS